MKFFSYQMLKVEMKRSFKGNMIWSLALGLSLLLIVAIYPIVKDMMASLVELMESFDENNPFIAVLEEFGGIPTTGLEYFATEGALILQLVGGIYAAIIGFGIVNKDEKEKTNEVLYTLPLSRSSVLTSKIMSVFLNLFIFTTIQFGLSIIGFVVIGETDNLAIFALFGLLNWMMFVIIAIFALGLSLLLKPNVSSLIPIAIPFPFYLLTVIAQATNNNILESLKYFSPFTFAEPVGFLKTDVEFAWVNFVIFIGLSIGITIFSYIKYQKRQIV